MSASRQYSRMKSVCHHFEIPVRYNVMRMKWLGRRKEVRFDTGTLHGSEPQSAPHLALTRKVASATLPCGPCEPNGQDRRFASNILRRHLFWRDRKINAHHPSSDFLLRRHVSRPLCLRASPSAPLRRFETLCSVSQTSRLPTSTFNTSALVVSGLWIGQLFRVVMVVELNEGR